VCASCVRVPLLAASANTVAVQQDWKTREFVHSVSLGVAQLTTFLNDFGAPPSPLKSFRAILLPFAYMPYVVVSCVP
jgi:hypothetical protein